MDYSALLLLNEQIRPLESLACIFKQCFLFWPSTNTIFLFVNTGRKEKSREFPEKSYSKKNT